MYEQYVVTNYAVPPNKDDLIHVCENTNEVAKSIREVYKVLLTKSFKLQSAYLPLQSRN